MNLCNKMMCFMFVIINPWPIYLPFERMVYCLLPLLTGLYINLRRIQGNNFDGPIPTSFSNLVNLTSL